MITKRAGIFLVKSSVPVLPCPSRPSFSVAMALSRLASVRSLVAGKTIEDLCSSSFLVRHVEGDVLRVADRITAHRLSVSSVPEGVLLSMENALKDNKAKEFNEALKKPRWAVDSVQDEVVNVLKKYSNTTVLTTALAQRWKTVLDGISKGNKENGLLMGRQLCWDLDIDLESNWANAVESVFAHIRHHRPKDLSEADRKKFVVEGLILATQDPADFLFCIYRSLKALEQRQLSPPFSSSVAAYYHTRKHKAEVETEYGVAKDFEKMYLSYAPSIICRPENIVSATVGQDGTTIRTLWVHGGLKAVSAMPMVPLTAVHSLRPHHSFPSFFSDEVLVTIHTNKEERK